MAILTKVGAFVKNAWDKEPVLVVSCAIAAVALMAPFVSPYMKYAAMYNKAVPYNYPVPVRDDGNMPDVPSHPSEDIGPNIKWLRDF